jgi:type I restriction enzyme R subunit
LSALLDKYADDGIADIDDKEVLGLDPLRRIGGPPKIFDAFNGEENYLRAVHELQNYIYESA